MKYSIYLKLQTILFAFCLISMSSACGDSGNKKAESSAPETPVKDSTAISVTEAERPAAPTTVTQETAPLPTKETSTLQDGKSASAKSKTAVPPAEKSKMPETSKTVKKEPAEVKTTSEQVKTNPATPPKPEPKKEEAKVVVPPPPAPPPAPVAVEKPKEVVTPPPPPVKPATPAPQPDPGKWAVPAKDKSKQNPVKADAESLSLGKSLYTKHCASCHGKKGHGDGSKAAQLDTKSGDFALPAFKSQTDGAIFYKIMEGRDDMPGFKKKLPDVEDVWSIVNYIKTL